jgi:hypothetical protein
MLNIIEPKDHSLHQNKIDPLLGLFKIYQDFTLSPKEQGKATFVIAEDDKRGIYGGAVFYPQKVKELHEIISELVGFIPENHTVWCVRLCFCSDQMDSFATPEAIETCENFYGELYEILGDLGKKKNTNCLPILILAKNFHNSVTFGKWTYFAQEHPKSHKSSPDYVYALLALPDKKRQSEAIQSNDQNQTDRHIQ